MKTAFLLGEKGNMGRAILSHWPKGVRLITYHDFTTVGADYLFLASTSEKSLSFLNQFQNQAKKIIDFSGATKYLALDSHPQITYGVKTWYDPSKQIVALPGCSSWGILSALKPLDKVLPEVVFADVKFSKSAMQFDSPNSVEIVQIQGLHTFTHYHQNEINKALNKPNLVQMAPSIVGLPSGLSINLFFAPLKDVNYIQEFNQNNQDPRVVFALKNPTLNQVIASDKILIYITQTEYAVNINIVMDNLVNNRFWPFL